MANEAKFKMSTERLEELKTELDYLQTVRKKEVEEQIKEARAFGDLSENSEFDEAKREQGKLYGRMAELKNLVENAEVVDAAAVGGGVGIGSVVVVLDLEDNYEAEYRIVGSQEADPANNLIS
ncbi:MAG: GreA/GreB family elongation factor, partial [Oscillospiraceae bacterium]|nr:GreA/GreB family elongation factor [Oscillospiraceae bacterium]